jgi:hypothetical protein
MAVYKYRGRTILYEIEKERGSAFWQAMGCVELQIGETTCAVFLRGAAQRFTSSDEANSSFIEHAGNWLDSLAATQEYPGAKR